MTKAWTDQQQLVFDTVAKGSGHCVVEARAGTGKTTTALESLYYTLEGSRVIFVAFNKIIADELKDRVPSGVTAMTLHSFGLRTITRTDNRRPIDPYAFRGRLDQLMINEKTKRWRVKTALCKIASSYKNGHPVHIDDPNELAHALVRCDVGSGCGLNEAIASEKHDANQHEAYYNAAIEIAARALNEAIDDRTGPIDFDDMIWLPTVQGTIRAEYDMIFVDETQDLSPTQLQMVCDMAGKKGRIVAIGDRYQSIYAFRGADATAIPRMISKLKASTTPLTKTFRCPQLVAKLAQEYVADFQAMPSNIEGEIRTRDMSDLESEAQANDFVISRTNAPLVRLCLRWIARGTSAKIRGRAIGDDLIKWIESTNATSVPMLGQCVESWKQAEVARRTELGFNCDEVYDRADCLHALSEGQSSVSQVVERCRKLFSDDLNAGSIQLMSTHKAKGLEADRTWILRDTYLRKFKGKEPDQQEINLYYVAITRTKREMNLVHGD